MDKVMVALSPDQAGPRHKEVHRSPGTLGEEAAGKQWTAKPFSE